MIHSIPRSWRMVKLGLCLKRQKDIVLPAAMANESVGLVGLEDIQDGGRGTISIRRIRPQEIESPKTPFAAGDILYGRLRPYLNKVGIAPQAGICSTEIWVFTPNPLVDSRFVTFFLASSFFVNRVAPLTKGANLPRLGTDAFDSIELPLPPLSEQQRIVEILQAAEQIRRLSAEAEAKTAELIPAMFYRHFIAGQEREFQPLHKLAEVVSGIAIGRKTKEITMGVPYLRVANVQAGFINLSEIKTTTATKEEVNQFGLKSGDVLLTEGGDFDKLGRGCLWEGQVEPCIHQNHVFRVRPIPGKLNSLFFAYYLQSARAKHYFLRCAKKTTNLASINLTQLKAFPVPTVSVEDQKHFELHVHVVRECMSMSSAVDCTALMRSLSAHAFSGQLTADWREAHRDKLELEARDRDVALKEAGATLSRFRRDTIQEMEAVFQDRTEGIYSDLNREQRILFREINRMVGGVRYARYFTAQGLSAYVTESPLRRTPQAIEEHLSVLAARGLIIPVSREKQTGDTGEFVFGNTYRLPLDDWSPREGEEEEPRVGDRARLRELERLATQLEMERALT